jgi:hypothetical protein
VFKGLANPGIKGNTNCGKVYNLWRMKTNISAVLTVTSGLDTHMIFKLKDDLNQ